MNYGVYIDFDNLIGGLIASLGIKGNTNLSPLKRTLFPIILKKFLQNLRILGNTKAIRESKPLFKKVFSEYHNLPLKNLLLPEPPVFLNNIGITPINPFVVSSGTKNKNASDISLTLEVVNDLVLKRIPLDAVVLFSGDIDFYPLISWIREHTGKDVFLISFSDRLKRAYIDIFRHLIGIENIIYAEYFLLEVLKVVSDYRFLESELKRVDLRRVLSSVDELKEWFEDVLNHLGKRKFPTHRVKLEDSHGNEFWTIRENIKVLKTFSEKELKFTILGNSCEKFREKLISGLKNWLKTHEKASTGLIIKSWFPRWKLNMSEEEANECLKKLIESGDLEKEGFRFEGSIEKDMAVGEIRRV